MAVYTILAGCSAVVVVVALVGDATFGLVLLPLVLAICLAGAAMSREIR